MLHGFVPCHPQIDRIAVGLAAERRHRSWPTCWAIRLLPYYGVFAPAGNLSAFIDAFSSALAKVLQQTDVHDPLVKLGLTVQHMSRSQLGQRERAYTKAWAVIIERSGFKPL